VIPSLYCHLLSPEDSELWRRGSNTGFRRRVRREAYAAMKSLAATQGEIRSSDQLVLESFELQLY
jgi:hypothetical protein